MNHAEHLGIAFANIVYAFLVTIDSEDYDAFICRMFERESREKQALIAFLMKKRVGRFGGFTDGAGIASDLDTEKSCNANDWNQTDRRGSVGSLNGISDAPVLVFLERNLAINDVVMQLTMVRNAFLEFILEFPKNDSLSSSYTTQQSIQQISNIPLITAADGVNKIRGVVSSLCNEVRQKYKPNPFSVSTAIPVRGSRTDAMVQGDCDYVQMLSSAVEIIWAYSLNFILASEDVAHIGSGGFVQCSQFLLRDLYREPSVGEARSAFRPSLCHLPPVFFLSFDLAMKLEEHFYRVLTSGRAVTRPSGMHLLLLSRVCYGLLSQLDEVLTEEVWKGLVRTCVLVMQRARVVSKGLEDIDWINLIHEADPSQKTANHGVLERELVLIWRRQQGLWITSTNEAPKVADNVWAANLPIFFRERLPSLFSSRLSQLVDLISDHCGLSKTSSSNRNEKVIVFSYSCLFQHAMQLCHIFTHRAGTTGPLKSLLELIHGMVMLSKREKRLKEVVTLVLSGCLLSHSAPQGSFASEAQLQERTQTEKIVETLLEEVDSWRKAKHAICYSLSTAALLGRCSLKELEWRLPQFFSAMGSWFATVNNMDRIAILHSTLHAGGLLCDVCASHDPVSPYRWNNSISSFFNCVEKILLSGVGCKGWKATSCTSSCIEIASDLLLFALQQEPFQSSALHWLIRLLDTKAKTKMLVRSACSNVMTRGRLIATRTIWALFELYHCGNNSVVGHEGPATRDVLLACTPTSESRRMLRTLYNAPLEQKACIKERIIGFISLQGTCYRPAVATVETVAIFWRGGNLKNVIHCLRTSEEVRRGINELREAAFSYVRQIHTSSSAEDIMEYTHQLVPVFLVARFWEPPYVLLEHSLVLPMLLVGPKTPLYEVVSKIVFPFYLLKQEENNMRSCALALHRLVECIIVVLENEENGSVAHLVEYVQLQLSKVRDRMESIVNEGLYIQKNEEGETRCRDSMEKDSIDREVYVKTLAARRAKWNWLLDVLETNPLQPNMSSHSLDSPDTCAVAAVRNMALIDELEGIAVVLLGHTNCQVRRNALLLLESVSSLLRLQRLHCGVTTKIQDTSLFDGTYCSSHELLRSPGNVDRLPLSSEEPASFRVSVAAIFEELGEQFDEMYVLNKERYMPLAHLVDGKASGGTSSTHEKFFEGSKQLLSTEEITLNSSQYDSNITRAAVSGTESTLLLTPFGTRCLSDIGTSTPHFVFVSTTALALLMYGYSPGSALLRVVCGIAKELVEKIVQRQMERHSPVWESCYVYNFLLLCVDNLKSSPDANRITRGGESNRLGHQQGGNSTFVGMTDDLKEIGCHILDRYEAYNHLMKSITVPLLVNEISTDNIPLYFLDMMQYLLLGPMQYVATVSTSLVPYCGIMDSEHPVMKTLMHMLVTGSSKTRRCKQTVFHTCYIVLLPMFLVISRRYFVEPPTVPRWKQNEVATQRTKMETILWNVIDDLLLGDIHDREYVAEDENAQGLSAEVLSRMLSDGNGVSVRSCLSLSSLTSYMAQSDGKSTATQHTLNDVILKVFLRGVLCDVIALVYSKEARFLEPAFKSKSLTKVLYSLKFQVLWFLDGHGCSPVRGFGRNFSTHMNVVMEKSILALQTVVSSLVQPAVSWNPLEHVSPIIKGFGERFFKWLQNSIPSDCKNLEMHAPNVFRLAVTLLVADSSLRHSVTFELGKLPFFNTVHTTFFSMIVTAYSTMAGDRKMPMLAQKCHGKATPSCARSVASNDTPFTCTGNSWKNDVTTLELKIMGNIIYYALVYLYKDETLPYVMNSTVRSKAYDLLELLCGEAPLEPMADPLDDWLCLILKTNRQGTGEGEADNRLVNYLFSMASEDILPNGRRTPCTVEQRRIALALLTSFLRRVKPTESHLRTVLRVTQVCRNTSSELALATLWGGWIAYEGRERERFVSILVGSPMDLTDKRMVTHYIDSYINHEMSLQGKSHSGKLDGRSRGAYYSFLLFSLYQMRLLREIVTHKEEKWMNGSEIFGESVSNFTRQGEGCSHSFLPRHSTIASSLDSPVMKNKKMNVNSNSKFFWIKNENIWGIYLKLTNKNLQENFGCSLLRNNPMEMGPDDDARECLEDPVRMQEVGFVKPLLSVLFFASWATERLQKRDWRLWKDLQRDLSCITGFNKNEPTRDSRSFAISHMFSSASEKEHVSEYEAEDSLDHLGSIAEHATHSDCPTSLTWDESKVPNPKDEQFGDEDDEEQEEERYAELEAEHRSEDSTDGTVVVNTGVPKTTVTEAIMSNMKHEAKLKKEAGLKRKNQIGDPFRLLHRDFVALFLHFACMLVVHMGFGEMPLGEESEELSSRFYVVETAFDVLGILLKDTATPGTCRSSLSLKHWLKLTFARLQRRLTMKKTQKKYDGGRGSLTFEPGLLFNETVFDLGSSDTPSSSVELVLKELFLNIMGQGRNIRGRHFLLRCLHEFSTWIQPKTYVEGDVKLWPHVLHSYISLLSLKVARVVSFCISCTTGVLVVGLDCQHKWMEKTAMQLVGASTFRRFISALSQQMNALKETHSTMASPFVRTKGHIFCASVLRSLACLLSDIIIHEIYYCTAMQTKNVEEKTQDAILLSTPFGDNSSFPAHYLLNSFWTGFAFLLDPNMWRAACDVLTVFHRYGCAEFLGTIPYPSLSLMYPLGINVTPDCAAVQLVLLRQGKEVILDRKNGEHPMTSENKDEGAEYTLDVVLNYLNEYASEKKDRAVLLAFTELLLLCDWTSLDYSTYAPKFTAFALEREVHRDSQSKPTGKSSTQRDLGGTPHSPVFRPFTRYVCYFAESWKRGLLLLPPGSERTAEGLASRMMFVLGEFFHMSVKVFGVPSVDVLLHRVIGETSWKRGSADVASTVSKSCQTDLCSLKSCVDTSEESRKLSDIQVTSFQRQFESHVLLPLMFLFQSKETPLPLWSKILSLVAALLRYHEKNHGFVTDQILKFLPDIERGLGMGTESYVFTDQTPLYDRLVVLVLADEVSSKVKRLRMAAWTTSVSISLFDTGSAGSLLASLLDNNHSLVTTLLDKLTSDPFSEDFAKNLGTSVHTETAAEVLQSNTVLRTNSEWEPKTLQSVIRKSQEGNDSDNEHEPPQLGETIRVPNLSDEENDGSSLILRPQPCTATTISHRFGGYFYEPFNGVNDAIQLTGQLPVEYYRVTANKSPLKMDLLSAEETEDIKQVPSAVKQSLDDFFSSAMANGAVPPNHSFDVASSVSTRPASRFSCSDDKKTSSYSM